MKSIKIIGSSNLTETHIIKAFLNDGFAAKASLKKIIVSNNCSHLQNLVFADTIFLE